MTDPHNEPLLIFGEDWAPHLPAEHYPETPIGTRCTWCTEHVQRGDRGLIESHRLRAVEPEYLVGIHDTGPLTAIHADCDLHRRIGNVVGVNPAHGWDQSRASAREAVRRWHELIRTRGHSVTDPDPPAGTP